MGCVCIMVNYLKMHKKIYNLLLILFFAVLSYLSSILLFHIHYLFGAGDMQFHLERLSELKLDVRHGNLLPAFSFNQFHGSAVMSLYPYINILPVAVLSLFVKSDITLVYISFDLNIFLSYIISYYGSLRFSKSKSTSILFSVFYSSSITFLAYGFYNMDLGALTSITVMPLIIFGIFNLINNNRWLELAIGMILLIFSHVLSTIIMFLFICLVLLINLKKINRAIIISLIKAITLTLMITSIVWIPAIHLLFNNIGQIYPPGMFHLTGVNLLTLIKNGVSNRITYNLSIFSVIGIFLPLILYKWIYIKFDRNIKQMYGVAIFVILMCSFFPWQITNYSIFKAIRVFQFTWRFYVIPECLLSYVMAFCIVSCISLKQVRAIFMLLLIFCAVAFQLYDQHQLINEAINSPSFTKTYVHDHNFISKGDPQHNIPSLKNIHFKYRKKPSFPFYKITNDNQLRLLTNVYTVENTPDYYMKDSLPKLNYINNNLGVHNNQSLEIKHIGYDTFSFDNKKRLNHLYLPLIHYNHENVHVYMDNHVTQFYSNKNDLISLSNINSGTHKIYIQYKPNLFLIMIKIILLIIGLTWLILLSLKHHLNSKLA